MTVYFMDMKTGQVYARSQGVRVLNGQLVPDPMGLPVVVEEPHSYPEDEDFEEEYPTD